MSTNFYSATIQPITASLTNLRRILAKGKSYADENGIAESDLLEMKLFDDMFDLRTQIGAIYLLVLSKGAFLVADIEGSPINPKPESIADLDANIAIMLSDLSSIDPEAYNAREDAEIMCALPVGMFKFESANKLMLQWSVPHCYFHVTTAYDILRNNGVPLTKNHFIGDIGLRPEPSDA